MGELSRFRGILGENIAKGFLNLIGWTSIDGFDIKCLDKKHNRRSHGIDYFTTYRSPVESNLAESVLISAKYLKDVSESDIDKEVVYMDNAMQCLQFTETYNEHFQNSFYNTRKHRLLYFCILDKNESSFIKKSVATTVSNTILNTSDITVVDNDRLEFIYDSISFTKKTYPKGNMEFFYHPTGMNDQLDKGLILSGKIMPIEYITSNILTFKVTIDNKKILLVTINEKFEKNSLKRVMAFCQRITLDWCNRIQICYPDYQLLKHKTIKESVFMSFEDKEFLDTIEVKNFHDSYISLEEAISVVNDSIPTNTKTFNAETLLPHGDMLRQLLVESYIGKKELVQVLQKRGLIPNKSFGKQELIPYLSKSLLSPNEFEFLRSKQAKAAKETVENFKHEELNKDIVNNISLAFPTSKQKIKQVIQNKYPNCSFAKDISISSLPNGAVSIKYDLNVRNSTKDWTKQESVQHGEIIFNTGIDGVEKITQIESISDSRISDSVNNTIKKQLIGDLKRTGIIVKTDKIQKIRVGEFTRPMRNEFLLSFFTNVPDTSSLVFGQVTYIDFTLDDDSEIFPDELLSLKNQIEEAEFKGHNLENTIFVTDKSYRGSIIFYAFVAEYFFSGILDATPVKGKVDIEFGFPDMKEKTADMAEKAEFSYKIKNIIPYVDRIINERESNELKMQVKKQFDAIRQSNISKYLTTVQLELFK